LLPTRVRENMAKPPNHSVSRTLSKNRRFAALATKVCRRSGERLSPSKLLSYKVSPEFLIVMATILRLPYTMAIAPSSRGGLLYGLSYDCQVSAGPRVLQRAESASHSSLPRPAGYPALCSSDPRRGGDHAHRATPPADGGAPQ